MQFDDLVQQLLEYWDRQYSDQGNVAQLPTVPQIPRELMSADLFPQMKPSAVKKKRKHRKNK
jgi:hypothetical protein